MTTEAEELINSVQLQSPFDCSAVNALQQAASQQHPLPKPRIIKLYELSTANQQKQTAVKEEIAETTPCQIPGESEVIGRILKGNSEKVAISLQPEKNQVTPLDFILPSGC